jgi:hemoglobin/transferrin/lactoferrin receptor protein
MFPTLLAAIVLAAQAPSGSAAGIVNDATGAPLPGAQVLIVCGEYRQTVVANAAGAFLIEGIPAERCLVVASLDGFVTERQPAEIQAAAPIRLTFKLSVRSFSAEVVVTPGRFDEETFRVPQGATVVGRDDLDVRPYTIVTQALREEAGVLSQQTTASQGSPILRGFTGQRNVFLIDGVRYNTAAWRDGPSQYMAWMPGADLDHIEIVRGPASAQYGSDALGGTIAMFSVAPGAGAPRLSGQAGFGYGSANGLRQSDVGVGVTQGRHWFYGGASLAAASDLRAGGGIDSHAAVTRYLGVPSSLAGERLENTGYTQSSAHARARLGLGSSRGLTVSYRHAQQDDSSRYDQELGGNGRYRSEFGPQTLDLGYARFETARLGWVDAASATLSINRQDDGRLEQQRPGARIDRQSNTTTAVGYQLQASRALQRSAATFGTEYYSESIDGVRTLFEPNGSRIASRPDIPNGTTYSSLGLYWQHGIDVSMRLHVRGGLRYGRFVFETTPDASQGVVHERITQDDTTFNVAAVAAVTPRLNATLSVSRGFRAANAFDFGGIGLSGGAGFEVAPGHVAALGGLRGSTDGATAESTGRPIEPLNPEKVMAYEAGIRWHSSRASAMVTVFNLEFRDAIERRTAIFPSSIVGREISGYTITRQDSVGRAFIQADARPVVTRVNVSRSRISGFEADGAAQIGRHVRVRAFGSSARGEELDTGTPRRRMPPVMGGLTVTWQPATPRWWAEATLLAAAKQDRLNDGDLGDARIGASRTPAAIATFFNGTAADRGWVQDGRLLATNETLAQVQSRVMGGAGSLPLFTSTPGYAVIGLRAGVTLGSRAELIVIGENLADRNYRLHGSGVDEPGMNVQTRLKLRF